MDLIKNECDTIPKIIIKDNRTFKAVAVVNGCIMREINCSDVLCQTGACCNCTLYKKPLLLDSKQIKTGKERFIEYN